MPTAQQAEQQQAALTVLRAGPTGVPLARQQQGHMAAPLGRMVQRMAALLGRHMVGQQEARMVGPQVGVTYKKRRKKAYTVCSCCCCELL
jgi:hypothetical protein